MMDLAVRMLVVQRAKVGLAALPDAEMPAVILWAITAVFPPMLASALGMRQWSGLMAPLAIAVLLALSIRGISRSPTKARVVAPIFTVAALAITAGTIVTVISMFMLYAKGAHATASGSPTYATNATYGALLIAAAFAALNAVGLAIYKDVERAVLREDADRAADEERAWRDEMANGGRTRTNAPPPPPPPPPPKTYENREWWEVLGVDRTCTKAQMETAARTLALQYHPDQHRTLPPLLAERAEQEMKAINVARDAARRHFKGGR